jgi:diguanylate cyclase (GGDEF)-like protein
MNVEQRLRAKDKGSLDQSDKILLVDDEENVLAAYHRALRGRYQIDTALNATEALQKIEHDGPYAVIVSDMVMPGMDGIKLLARCKSLSPGTVRMMVTGNADQRTAVMAVNESEVYRFLNKPCTREDLMDALDGALNFYRQGNEERTRLNQSLAAMDKLSAESTRDPLTGLHNRHAFQEGLRESLAAAADGKAAPSALCHLDLDHFHLINETSGHLAGDALLRAVGVLLTSKCGVNDLVGRIAGDDYAILFQGATLDQARAIVNDICNTLKNFNFEWEGSMLDTRVSIGLVPIDVTKDTATQLMSAAENACLVALDFGGGQVRVVADAHDSVLTERINQAQWVNRIRNALREDHFRLYAQRIVPIVEAMEGDHYELLIRMLDEAGKVVSPGCFLGTAEQYNLSSQIDRWVIGKAEDWLSRHEECLDRLSFCSINLSGHSIGQPEILHYIRDIFTHSKVPPGKICFEITETAAIAHMKDAVRFIRQLKGLGFRFALDDFGSGLSSFGYLKSLPVDYLKLDGLFVKEIDVDEVNRAIVRCINEVAKVMGKQTIAEYVENEQILQQLKIIGVDFAQGHHFGMPAPLETLC